ncbi:MAG: hypothetical protein GF308_13770 [Candidatus Heimdallarchaeota archaeon]|nr:hypothetical protein [Candidatus Heimdallarchaeota archaeon]
MPPTINQLRPPLHLDYFRDQKARICQVLTWHHPIDRRLCILKYLPGNSHWLSRETGLRYRRILKSYSLAGQLDNLKTVTTIEPKYLYHSSVYDADFLAVPIEQIAQYYYPEQRLEEILKAHPSNQLPPLEGKVFKLAGLIHDHLKIPLEDMGISGSIIWRGQTSKSDINFMIYGNENAKNFNERFPKIYDVTKEITPLLPTKRRKYERSLSRKTGLPPFLLERYIKLKSWLSIFNGTDLSFHFNPKPAERPFKYGQQFFKVITPVDVRGFIKDSSFGYNYPGIYQLSDCSFIGETVDHSSKELPKRILSFEGAFTGYFKKGDEIVIRGLLEKVYDSKENYLFNQIILGTKECQGNEFILFADDYKSFFQ